MPKTIQDTTGDGITVPFVNFALTLPDAGGSITLEGQVSPAEMPAIAITGSPLTGPAVPGAGSTWWIIQVNYTTGAATIKTSASATPTADANNVAIFSDVVASTDATIAVNSGDQSVDTW